MGDLQRDNETREVISQLKPTLAALDIDIDNDHVAKLPTDGILALGVAFSSLPEALRSVTTAMSGPGDGLYRAFTAAGNLISPDMLHTFNNGFGYLGNLMTPDGGVGGGLAHLVPVDNAALQIQTSLPYNPAMLFIAAALMQINQKLDTIQETQNKMFEYLKQKDKAELRGDLATLWDVVTNYQFNWDSDTYKNNKQILVQDIKRKAEQHSVHLRARIGSSLQDNGLFHLRNDVRNHLNEAVDNLKEYQLSIYLFAFSSMLEVLLLENFEHAYIVSVVDSIKQHELQYRELYSHCYDAIEEMSKSSLDARALGGIAEAGKMFGKFLASTPIGEQTPLDDAITGASNTLANQNESDHKQLLERILSARPYESNDFTDTLETLDCLHNEDVLLLSRGDTFYLAPVKPSGNEE